MPEEYVTGKIAKAFADFESIENLKILLMRAEVANPELPKLWKQWGRLWMTLPATGPFRKLRM